MKKTYASVVDPTTGPSPALAVEVREALEKRRLVKALIVLRTRAGLTQKELARKMGCKKRVVRGMEEGEDADLRLRDLLLFVGALGGTIRLTLSPGEA